MPLEELLVRVARIPGASAVESRPDGLWMTAPQLDVEAMARDMHEAGFRLCTMSAVALPDGETTVIYHYAQPGQAINFKTRTRGQTLPSIAPNLRPASWIEREIHDLYAVNFTGHPDLKPLLRPVQLEDGFFRDASCVARTADQR